MKYIFWICWAGEMLAVLFWIASELKLKYLSPNPFSFISALYLLIVLALHCSNTQHTVTVMMVIVPAIPLLVMLLLVMIHSLSGGRWN